MLAVGMKVDAYCLNWSTGHIAYHWW